jgi:dethiobiotin synthetase
MFPTPLRLTKPGLFITGTDTGVGKTVITCAIAASLRQTGARVGVCKPFATGCRKEREGLVSEDAEALAHFSDCRQPLDVINPVRYVLPVAPAVAAEVTGGPVDFDAIARSLMLLAASSDCVLIEGVGGLMVPIDDRHPRLTVLDMIAAVGYPVVVVVRAVLGTLNHSAMTVKLLRERGCLVAGLVINGYDPDSSRSGDVGADVSMTTNRRWLEKMNGISILATVPVCPAGAVAPERGVISPAVLDAVNLTYWPDVLGSASPIGSGST